LIWYKQLLNHYLRAANPVVFAISLDLFALRRAEMAKIFYRSFSISLPFPYTQKHILRREKYMNALLRLLAIAVSLTLVPARLTLASAPPIQWQNTFGGSGYDVGYSVQQTSDDGYIIAGYTSSFGPGDPNVYLIKTDPNGDIHWQKTFGGSSRDEGGSVRQTSDGGYIIAGVTDSFGAGNYDVYLIKTEPNGNSQWQKTFGSINDEWGLSAQQTTDGGYIITGYTYYIATGNRSVYLIKTEPNGNSQWEKTFYGIGTTGQSVQQTSDGGYIIAGYIHSYNPVSINVYLLKTDPNGNSQWAKTFGGISWDHGFSARQTSDGGYIIAGETRSYGAGYGDVYLAKTDPNGNKQWQNTFGGSELDGAYSVQQTLDGGYIIAGKTDSFGAGWDDVYLVKTDPNGDSQWQKTVGGSNREVVYSVQQTADGGYVITGYTYSYSTSGNDVYLIKLCPDGTLPADFNCDGTVYYEDLAILADEWLQPPVMLSADIFPEFGDSIVNGFDFAALANDWLQSSIP
jgi:hypothetical protein